MRDQYTETTTKNWGQRLSGSFKGLLGGLIMFIASFAVLYWNEGRVDVSNIAKKAIEIDPAKTSREADGKLVAAFGDLTTDETLDDTYLKEGDYLVLIRKVEMYAWVQHSKSKTEKKIGGSEVTKTTYTYKKEWTENPSSSEDFKVPRGHYNPPLDFNSERFSVNKAKIGNYEIDIKEISLPAVYEDVVLDTSNVIIDKDVRLIGNKYLFKGEGSLSQPDVGNVRISYSYIPNPLKDVTVFGKLNVSSKRITPFYGKKDAKLYRVFKGTKDSAISTMKKEHTVMMWIFRILGFLLMWFGLMALFGPIVTFLDVLPILGSIGRAGISIVTFIIAFVLSILTIIISMILHSFIAMIVVLVLVVAGIIFFIKTRKPKNKGLVN